ncbi:MAG: hypothetical protein KGI33_07320 [Thaumarchaeota archaeon]|nr:hypothetical protein [Nitrososphaerota archaeon]
MALDHLDRGFLEKEIDNQIVTMPVTMRLARTGEFTVMANIQNHGDFCLGYAIATIMRATLDHYFNRHRISMPREEQQELATVINNRTKEIREAIFKCG